MRNNPKPSRSHLLSRVRHDIPLYLMFLPGAIYLLINNYIPMAGLVIAFKQVDCEQGHPRLAPGSGFQNFEFLFTDQGRLRHHPQHAAVQHCLHHPGHRNRHPVRDPHLNEISSMVLKKTYQTVDPASPT